MQEQIQSILNFYQKDFYNFDEKTLKAYIVDINIDQGGILATKENENILKTKFPKLDNKHFKISKITKVLKDIKKEDLIKILIGEEENRLKQSQIRDVLDEYHQCLAS